MILLDADAMIADFDYSFAEMPFETVFVAQQVVMKYEQDQHGPPSPSNVNIGVTLWNLHHPLLRRILRQWHRGAAWRIVRQLPDNDQKVLQRILERRSERATMIVTPTLNQFGYDGGRLVQHFIRRSPNAWTVSIEDVRMRLVQEAAQKTCQKYAPACDNIVLH
jgi:hypothetical protein